VLVAGSEGGSVVAGVWSAGAVLAIWGAGARRAAAGVIGASEEGWGRLLKCRSRLWFRPRTDLSWPQLSQYFAPMLARVSLTLIPANSVNRCRWVLFSLALTRLFIFPRVWKLGARVRAAKLIRNGLATRENAMTTMT
jgi:hypothetical protein